MTKWKIIRNLIGVCIFAILCLRTVNYSAVYTDTDEDAFVTKAEFEAIKTYVQGQLDAYNNNLDNAIDDAITNFVTELEGGGVSADFYDNLYPVGTVIIANEHPKFGVWQSLNSSVDRALWLCNGEGWGQTIEQAIPIPLVTTERKVAHTHSFTGETIVTEEQGYHNHSVSINLSLGQAYTIDSGGSQKAKGNAYDKETDNSVNHQHTFTPEGTIKADKHKHTLPAINEAIYNGSSAEIKPDLYFIKMWQRIE